MKVIRNIEVKDKYILVKFTTGRERDDYMITQHAKKLMKELNLTEDEKEEIEKEMQEKVECINRIAKEIYREDITWMIGLKWKIKRKKEAVDIINWLTERVILILKQIKIVWEDRKRIQTIEDKIEEEIEIDI